LAIQAALSAFKFHKQKRSFFMKAKRVLVCGLMVVILSLAFVTCDSGGGGGGGNPTPQTVTYSGTANGTAYTLKITENLSRAAYTPQAGDSYELTAGTNKSTGTVDSYSNGSFTLKPSNAETFTATVSGNNLTGLTGSSKWDNGTAFTAPGTLTPGGGGGGGGGNNLTAEEMAEIKEGLQTFYDFIVAFDGEAAWGEAINEINAEIPGLNLPKTNPSTWSNAVWNRLAEHADEFADVIDKILGEEGGGDFVAVTNITGVPATATAGTALTLTGTVEPSTATNKTIAWSVVSGTATISGSTLNATAAGQVTVKATIANGTAQGTNYTKDFVITVGSGGPSSTFTLTGIPSEHNGKYADFYDYTSSVSIKSNVRRLISNGLLQIQRIELQKLPQMHTALPGEGNQFLQKSGAHRSRRMYPVRRMFCYLPSKRQ
jgi:hypothetical protein